MLDGGERVNRQTTTPDAPRGILNGMTTADFAADADGLREALRRLLEVKSAGAAEPGDLHAPTEPPAELPAELPPHGVGGRAALDLLAPIALDAARRLDAPGFFAHMDPPTPWMTWAATQWAAAMNQNLLHPDTAPAARRLEETVVDWLATAFGMTGGHLVPGSSVANLTALWAARELTGARRVVASTAAHLSIRKAAHLLGLAFEAVPTGADGRMREDALPGRLDDAIVVLTAGTTATGVIDPLGAAASAAWRHVDAAWAGPLRLSSHAPLLDGVEHADSVAISAHKWLYQPKESAAVLFADVAAAHEAISFGGGYLAVPNVGLLGSHGASALPLAATLLAWGRDGLGRLIDDAMAAATDLARRVAAEPTLELWGEPATGVVVWRPRGLDPLRVRDAMRAAYVSVTQVEGETWLRSVAANPFVDVDAVVESVVAAAALRRSAGDARPVE